MQCEVWSVTQKLVPSVCVVMSYEVTSTNKLVLILGTTGGYKCWTISN